MRKHVLIGKQRRRKVAFLSLGALMIFGCGNHNEEQSELSRFFQNSTRRDPTQIEKDQTAKLGGCTAFFVRNSQNRALMVSARHCVSMAITQWCTNKGTVKTNDGHVGTCQRIVAADTQRDIALFEVQFEDDFVPSNERGVRLASFEPKVNVRLRMTGFPADQYRLGQLTTTENCWILSTRVNSPHGNMFDRSSLHNCTTWGGNSGGPMMIENTDIAIGLPFTYAPGDYTYYSPYNIATSAYMAQMADFVGAHRAALTQVGVNIADSSR